jgi:hypothetical protein
MANFDLSKLMEGKNPQQVMLAETRQLQSKWAKTGLLEKAESNLKSQYCWKTKQNNCLTKLLLPEPPQVLKNGVA